MIRTPYFRMNECPSHVAIAVHLNGFPKCYAYVLFNPIGNRRWQLHRMQFTQKNNTENAKKRRGKKNSDDDECINCRRLALKMQIYCWQMKHEANHRKSLPYANTDAKLQTNSSIVCSQCVQSANMFQLRNNEYRISM